MVMLVLFSYSSILQLYLTYGYMTLVPSDTHSQSIGGKYSWIFLNDIYLRIFFNSLILLLNIETIFYIGKSNPKKPLIL